MSVITDAAGAVDAAGQAHAAATPERVMRERVPAATARLGHIEAIRGIACLMVVAYHVIGNDPLHGMHMPEGSLWWAIPRLLDAVQMPLFAFVSGWVFSIATGDFGLFRAALLKKLMRLALPMASVSLLYLAAASAAGKAEGRTVLDVLILPYQHLWYLQASLWLVTVAALGALAMRGRPIAFAGLGLAVSTALFLPVPRFTPNLLALEQAIYLAPFFFVGHLARVGGVETSARATPARLTATLGGLMALTIAAAVATWAVFHAATAMETWVQTTPAFVFASALALGLMLARPRSVWLEAIGARSFTIYLFHVLFTAPTREVVTRVWPGIPSPILFAVVFAIGVALPFLLHGVLSRHRWSAVIFLGQGHPGRSDREAAR